MKKLGRSAKMRAGDFLKFFRSSKRGRDSKESIPRIAGGQNAPHGSAPWQVNTTEPVFSNVYGAPELIPRKEFRQPM